MGAAYFIVLERTIEGIDTGMDGKHLSAHIESLDEAARQLGVRPLSEFYSADPEQLVELIDGLDASALSPLKQFAAEVGLITVRALTGHSASKVEGVSDDLRECERVLSAAVQHGIGWHFAIDI